MANSTPQQGHVRCRELYVMISVSNVTQPFLSIFLKSSEADTLPVQMQPHAKFTLTLLHASKPVSKGTRAEMIKPCCLRCKNALMLCVSCLLCTLHHALVCMHT